MSGLSIGGMKRTMEDMDTVGRGGSFCLRNKMPLLSLKMINDLRDRPVEVCFVCQKASRKNYCRQCDEFYMQGCDCNEHKGHRTYDLDRAPEPHTYVE